MTGKRSFEFFLILFLISFCSAWVGVLVSSLFKNEQNNEQEPRIVHLKAESPKDALDLLGEPYNSVEIRHNIYVPSENITKEKPEVITIRNMGPLTESKRTYLLEDFKKRIRQELESDWEVDESLAGARKFARKTERIERLKAQSRLLQDRREVYYADKGVILTIPGYWILSSGPHSEIIRVAVKTQTGKLFPLENPEIIHRYYTREEKKAKVESGEWIQQELFIYYRIKLSEFPSLDEARKSRLELDQEASSTKK